MGVEKKRETGERASRNAPVYDPPSTMGIRGGSDSEGAESRRAIEWALLALLSDNISICIVL